MNFRKARGYSRLSLRDGNNDFICRLPARGL